MIPYQHFPGRLVSDPELRFTSNGKPCSTFRLACSDSRKTQTGEWETTNQLFIQVTLWGEAAEPMSYLRKGSKVTVVGKLVTEEWEAKDGSQRSMIKVMAVDALQSVADVEVAGSQARPGHSPAQNGGAWGSSPPSTPQDTGEPPF